VLTTSVSVSGDELDANASNDTAQAETTVTPVSMVDLWVTVDDGDVSGVWGEALGYTITVTNDGPDDVMGARVTDSFPTELEGVSWSCVADAGSSCTASGSGEIDDSVDLLAGGSATYTATGVVAMGTVGPLQNTASVSVGAGFHDGNSLNDSDTESTPIAPPANMIFYDGFESGDTSAWSSAVGKPEGSPEPTQPDQRPPR
jgi:uncharacterized repeat protein (TIGR01451 family)